MDRASASGAEGCGFEPRRAHQDFAGYRSGFKAAGPGYECRDPSCVWAYTNDTRGITCEKPRLGFCYPLINGTGRSGPLPCTAARGCRPARRSSLRVAEWPFVPGGGGSSPHAPRLREGFRGPPVPCVDPSVRRRQRPDGTPVGVFHLACGGSASTAARLYANKSGKTVTRYLNEMVTRGSSSGKAPRSAQTWKRSSPFVRVDVLAHRRFAVTACSGDIGDRHPVFALRMSKISTPLTKSAPPLC